MSRQGGFALGSVLMLLAVLATLATAGFAMAVLAQALANRDAYAALAFEAAETGLARLTPATLELAPAPRVTVTTSLRESHPATAPPAGFSAGEGGAGLVVRHYTATATGAAPLGTRATHEVDFHVLAAAD